MITDKGKKDLGKFLRRARLSQDWTMQDVSDELMKRTGFKITTSVISDLENGYREPQWNTLAKLVSLQYIRHPQTLELYQVGDLFKIACEQIDPETGVERELATCVGC